MNRKLIAAVFGIVVVFGVVVLAACRIALAQTPTRPPATTPDQPMSSAPDRGPTSSRPAHADPRPEDLTIDQILDAVDNIRDQKADLEKKEKFYLRALHRKTEKLQERIDRMDPQTTTPTTCPGPVPPVLVQPSLQTPACTVGIPTSNILP